MTQFTALDHQHMAHALRLAERAAELIRLAPPIQPLVRYRLDDMQAATLALYADVAATPRQRSDD